MKFFEEIINDSEEEQELPERGPEWEENLQTVRNMLEDKGICYREQELPTGLHLFEFRISGQSMTVLASICIEEDPENCQINISYPFRAEPEFVYPLCTYLMKLSFQKRYGNFKYDEHDGEIYCQYTLPIAYGLHEDVLDNVFLTMLSSIFTCYDDIRRYAAGRYRRQVRDEIICNAQTLIIELSA